MKTKLFSKKTITGGVAAALLIGSFAYAPQAKPAYAAELQQPAVSSPLVAKYLQNLATYTAWVSDREEDDVLSDVSYGKTLADASGLSASLLRDKLVSNFDTYVSLNAQGQNLSGDQIQKLHDEAASLINDAIMEHGYKAPVSQASMNLDSVIQQRLNLIVSDVAAISNDDVDDIENRLESGATLVKASGLSQEALFEALTGLMNLSIDNAVGQTPVSSDAVQQAKEKAADKIREAINTAGGYKAVSADQGAPSLDNIVKRRIAFIISDAATIADKDYNDVLQDLKSGKTLPDATGVAAGLLSSELNRIVQQDIDHAAEQGSFDTNAIESAKSSAGLRISEILSEGGYTGEKETKAAGNISALVQERLKGIVSDAALIADKKYYEVEDKVNAGASLSAATGISGGELFDRLIAPVNQMIETMTNDPDQQAKAKEQAAKQIRTWVDNGYNN
ncbi:hypothetical protein SK3146_05910 [Paenibacillus konkukensis]|uniref:SLH domain-containing protein n=1 Tax=Paenibacillus konkukensis TaxID=2020716 RepID=A0ABY4RYY5_9BACL|nr:hypothetical protein [Paenibacillus konkukensis]UQZ86617.1 hypothetical protein SK3146_05910 [Paenibacillus konkukensis]